MATEIQRVVGLFGAWLKRFPGGTPGSCQPAFSEENAPSTAGTPNLSLQRDAIGRR
jgi:hypothetical protein